MGAPTVPWWGFPFGFIWNAMAISNNKRSLVQLREMAASGVPGPDWHPDPTGRHATRYWDGQRWTDRVSDVTSDPVGPQP